MKKIYDEKIQAIIPQYTNIGDSTYVYTFEKSKIILNVSIRSALRKIFNFYTVDHLALKNKFRKMGIYQNAPIILEKNVFVKVKVRKPIGKSDGAYGYVNVKSIKSLTEKENKTIVELRDGFKIISLDKKATLSKNMIIGYEINNRIEDKDK